MPPLLPIVFTASVTSVDGLPPLPLTHATTDPLAPLRICVAVAVAVAGRSRPLIRVWAVNGTNSARSSSAVASV